MEYYPKSKKIKITMKNILSILFISLLVSCGSQVSDLELRVAKLETEIASMRKGGVSSIVPAGAFPKFTFNEEEHNFGVMEILFLLIFFV